MRLTLFFTIYVISIRINSKLSLESIQIPSSFATSGIIGVEKSGNVCVLSISRNKNALNRSTVYTVCTLPEEYRPHVTTTMLITIGSSTPINAYLAIDANGDVTVNPFYDVVASSYFYIRAVYYC